jgi:hypothetical protein
LFLLVTGMPCRVSTGRCDVYAYTGLQ